MNILVVFGSCNIFVISEIVGLYSVNVLLLMVKLILDYLIEFEIDLIGEKSRVRFCVWM